MVKYLSPPLYIGKCVLIEEESGRNKGDGERALVIGDLHLGYEHGLGIGGVDLGEKRFKEILGELDKIFAKIENKIDKIVLLGDLKHGFSELSEEERNQLTRFFDYLQEKMKREGEIIVIRGNHDNYLLNLTAKRKIGIEEGYFWRGNYFVHGDCEREGMWGEKVDRIFMAHLHPSVRLMEGIKSEVYKCFLEGKEKGKEIIVLPSFAEIGEGIDVRELEAEKVWGFRWRNFKIRVAGAEEVYDFGILGDLK